MALSGLGGLLEYQPETCQIGSSEPWDPCPVDNNAGFGKPCAWTFSEKADNKVKTTIYKNNLIADMILESFIGRIDCHIDLYSI